MEPPGPVRGLIEKRTSLTILALVVATAIMQPLDLGWRQLQILAYVGLVGLLVEFWLESTRQRGQVAGAERDCAAALNRASEAEAAARRLPELQADLYRIEQERDQLRQQLRLPSTSLEQTLASIDKQLEFVALATKHRELQAEVGGQWPVTHIALQDDSVVVRAHIDDQAERVTNEWVSLIDPAGNPLVVGQVSQAADHQLTAFLELGYFPDYLQEPLLDAHTLHPAGYHLKLFGLALAAYESLHDDQLSAFGSSLREASRNIAQILIPQGITMTENLQAEEGDIEQ